MAHRACLGFLPSTRLARRMVSGALITWAWLLDFLGLNKFLRLICDETMTTSARTTTLQQVGLSSSSCGRDLLQSRITASPSHTSESLDTTSLISASLIVVDAARKWCKFWPAGTKPSDRGLTADVRTRDDPKGQQPNPLSYARPLPHHANLHSNSKSTSQQIKPQPRHRVMGMASIYKLAREPDIPADFDSASSQLIEVARAVELQDL